MRGFQKNYEPPEHDTRKSCEQAEMRTNRNCWTVRDCGIKIVESYCRLDPVVGSHKLPVLSCFETESEAACTPREKEQKLTKNCADDIIATSPSQNVKKEVSNKKIRRNSIPIISAGWFGVCLCVYPIAPCAAAGFGVSLRGSIYGTTVIMSWYKKFKAGKIATVARHLACCRSSFKTVHSYESNSGVGLETVCGLCLPPKYCRYGDISPE
eukprot:scaffold624_cov176-Amphora_coffeaeformis.AAC.7